MWLITKTKMLLSVSSTLDWQTKLLSHIITMYKEVINHNYWLSVLVVSMFHRSQRQKKQRTDISHVFFRRLHLQPEDTLIFILLLWDRSDSFASWTKRSNPRKRSGRLPLRLGQGNEENTCSLRPSGQTEPRGGAAPTSASISACLFSSSLATTMALCRPERLQDTAHSHSRVTTASSSGDIWAGKYRNVAGDSHRFEVCVWREPLSLSGITHWHWNGRVYVGLLELAAALWAYFPLSHHLISSPWAFLPEKKIFIDSGRKLRGKRTS